MGSFKSIVSKKSLHRLESLHTMPILNILPDDHIGDQCGPQEPIGLSSLVRYSGGRATENSTYIYVGAALGVPFHLNRVEICNGTCGHHKKWWDATHLFYQVLDVNDLFRVGLEILHVPIEVDGPPMTHCIKIGPFDLGIQPNDALYETMNLVTQFFKEADYGPIIQRNWMPYEPEDIEKIRKRNAQSGNHWWR